MIDKRVKKFRVLGKRCLGIGRWSIVAKWIFYILVTIIGYRITRGGKLVKKKGYFNEVKWVALIGQYTLSVLLTL